MLLEALSQWMSTVLRRNQVMDKELWLCLPDMDVFRNDRFRSVDVANQSLSLTPFGRRFPPR